MTFSSCDDDPIIDPETITVIDTIFVSNVDTVFVSLTDTLFISTTDTVFLQDDAEVTCFILVRHAEKEAAGNDPNLTAEGMARAERLSIILSQLKLDRVYSTDFKRTRQTAIPTADNQGLNISNYGGFDHNEVIDDILENDNQGKILIVGHSNTTPNFINALTGTLDYPVIDEDTFDDLFIVKTKSKGDSEVIHLKY